MIVCRTLLSGPKGCFQVLSTQPPPAQARKGTNDPSSWIFESLTTFSASSQKKTLHSAFSGLMQLGQAHPGKQPFLKSAVSSAIT